MQSSSVSKEALFLKKRKGMCVIWPIYFDARESRALRRVPRALAIPAPRLDELCAAVERLGLRYEPVVGAAHPAKHWEKTGYLFVEKRWPKEELIRRIAKALRKVRALSHRKA